MVPNFIAAFFILGIIGLLEIPLDMMTITIAAITIGIAVDNSIHYIYRFKEEFSLNKKYHETSISKIPIKRSIASRALIPSLPPNVSEETKIIPATSQATTSATIHSSQRLGS